MAAPWPARWRPLEEELASTKAQLNRAKAQLIAVKRNNAELEEEMDALLEIVADLKEQLDQDL